MKLSSCKLCKTNSSDVWQSNHEWKHYYRRRCWNSIKRQTLRRL